MPSTPPIRILHVLEATTGGTRRHLYHLLTGLPRDRFQTALAYAALRDPHFRRDLKAYAALGVELFEVPMRRAISPLHDLLAWRRIVAILRRGRFDIVHTHSSKAGFLGRFAARFARVPAIVHTPHSFAFQYCPDSPGGRLYLALERLAGRFHHRMVCVSEGERRVALRHGVGRADRIAVIPNTIRRTDLQPRRSRDSIRAEFGLPAGAPVVGAVAQLRPQKGFIHFIRAIPRVLEEHGAVRFLIIGDGPLRRRIQADVRDLGIENRVVFAGHQENIADFYQVMDVFTLASLWEGMPYAILEAMASGLAIVATDVVGNRDLVRPGRNGLIVPPAAPDALADAVNHLLAHPDERRRYAEENLREAVRFPDPDAWARRYVDLYEALLDGARGGARPAFEPQT